MRTAAICFLALTVGAPALAGSTCAVEHVSFPYDVIDDAHRWIGSRDIEMILSHDGCIVRRLVIPHFACTLSIGTQHGSLGFSCGRALDGSWKLRDAGNPHSYFDTIGEGPGAEVPSPKSLKAIYDHLDDDDAAKPIYKDDFPARFTAIGPRVSIPNPDFQTSVQSLRYRTIAGEERVAFSADAVVGCIKYQFGLILRPPRTDNAPAREAERDLSTFVGDLRLEMFDDPVPTLQTLHTARLKEAMLAPILACYRARDGGAQPR